MLRCNRTPKPYAAIKLALTTLLLFVLKDTGSACMIFGAGGSTMSVGAWGLGYGCRQRLEYRIIDPDNSRLASGSPPASVLTLYGWTRNPLIEYYALIAAFSRPGSAAGTVSSMGHHNLGTSESTPLPLMAPGLFLGTGMSGRESITGGNQTITFANHVNAWNQD